MRRSRERRVLYVEVEEPEKAALARVAEARGVTISELIREVLRALLEEAGVGA